MAIGGSYGEKAFTPKDPWRTWAEVQGLGLYWDTDNQFAAGKQGVRMIDTPGVSQGRTPRYDLGVGAPVGSIQRARATPVNMFGSARPISAGGRNYGDQSIDRNELARLSSTGSTIAEAVTPVAGRIGERWRERRAQRKAEREAIPEEVLPAQPHTLATSNWREVQAQRIAEQAMGQPGQPAPDVTLGSRMYQEERAQERANRPAPAPAPGVTTSAQRWENARRLQAEREAAAKFERENKGRAPVTAPPGGVGTAKIFPRGPISMVGDQNARLAAEGAAPAQPAPKTGRK